MAGSVGQPFRAAKVGRAKALPYIVGLVTVLVFLPALGYPFLNWDDQEVFVRNDALRAPGVLGWAFTTRYMEHYQPMAWLTWAGIDRAFELTPAAAHALNVGLHALCAALVCVLAMRMAVTVGMANVGTGLKARPYHAELSATVAALVWSLHPLRVEPIAWASAMPYALAAAFALTATLAWVNGRGAIAVVLFAVSLLARPIALLLPAVLWLLRRPASVRERAIVGVMAIAAAATAFVESSARLTATLTEFGVGARLTLAATAPWRYLWRTIWPVDLTPLDPLALSPRTEPIAIALGLAGIALVSAAAWRWRREQPVVAVAWASYLLLLAPAMGLVPSGLQATADRYTYLPAVPMSVAIAWVFARAEALALPDRSRPDRLRSARARSARALALATSLMVGGLAVVTWRQTHYWRDSISLWTRAVTIDPRNDVALYNLGAALADAGRRSDAIARYDQVLALVPNNDAARRNRDLLEAERFEEEASALAANRRLDAAIARYSEAVRLDPRRTHSQAALGVALTQLGRYAEARPHLQTAIELGATDSAIPNALAYGLMESGNREDAIAVLRDALRRHPDDENIARNLAMLVQKKGGPEGPPR
jgi:Flp pilus assembly protein TadD